MKICIDAGHGGIDPGAVGTTPFRLDEKTINLALASHLEQVLETRGHWVVLTRRQDRTLALADRAAYANRLGAELFISLHLNAATDPSVEGMEVFHFPGSTAGQQFAEQVLEALATAFPDHRNRGVKSASFAVLRGTLMPAILIECEFITNPQQLRFLANPAHWDLIAQAIADGLELQPAIV